MRVSSPVLKGSKLDMKWEKVICAVTAWPLGTDIIQKPILTGNLLQIFGILIQLRLTTLKK
jgi:hypothetical protein